MKYTQPTIRIHDWDYHRNGICGAPFHVFLFTDTDDERTRKVGILFEAPQAVEQPDYVIDMMREMRLAGHSYEQIAA
jgi:hypothetical protein